MLYTKYLHYTYVLLSNTLTILYHLRSDKLHGQRLGAGQLQRGLRRWNSHRHAHRHARCWARWRGLPRSDAHAGLQCGAMQHAADVLLAGECKRLQRRLGCAAVPQPMHDHMWQPWGSALLLIDKAVCCRMSVPVRLGVSPCIITVHCTITVPCCSECVSSACMWRLLWSKRGVCARCVAKRWRERVSGRFGPGAGRVVARGCHKPEFKVLDIYGLVFVLLFFVCFLLVLYFCVLFLLLKIVWKLLSLTFVVFLVFLFLFFFLQDCSRVWQSDVAVCSSQRSHPHSAQSVHLYWQRLFSHR